MDLNNGRTGRHATKPRALGLLGHSVIYNIYFLHIFKVKGLTLEYGMMITANVVPSFRRTWQLFSIVVTSLENVGRWINANQNWQFVILIRHIKDNICSNLQKWSFILWWINLTIFQEALCNAGDLGRDYEHCCELQKKANDLESAVSLIYLPIWDL